MADRGLAATDPDVVASSGDFDLTLAELREVARFAVSFAADVLPVFEAALPAEDRPRLAVHAARAFIGGEPRSRSQREAAIAAHRAARLAPDEASRLAGQAAGDPAAAERVLAEACDRATPVLTEVLSRYPEVSLGAVACPW